MSSGGVCHYCKKRDCECPDSVTAKLAYYEKLEAEWMEGLMNKDASILANGLSKTVTAVYSAVTQFGPAAINLSGLDPDKVNGVHLAVILRVTHEHKDKVPGWQEALEVAKLAVIREGHTIEEVLSGL